MRRTSPEIPTMQNRKDRGFVLITMGMTVIALVGVLGIAVSAKRSRHARLHLCDRNDPGPGEA